MNINYDLFYLVFVCVCEMALATAVEHNNKCEAKFNNEICYLF